MSENIKLIDVDRNFRFVASESKKEGASAAKILESNNSLLWWALAHNIADRVKEEKDMILVEAFWGLCRDYKISLTEEEKKKIFFGFLED